MTSYFSVKNFEKYQHYKDRNPPWIKFYVDLLENYEFAGLPDQAKWHLVAIWLLASRYQNRIPLDAEWVRGKISAKNQVDLIALHRAGFLVSDQWCSNLLSEPEQSARPETETETETEASFSLRSNESSARKFKKADFDAFWVMYPHKIGKGAALKAFPAAMKRAVDLQAMFLGLERYIKTKPPDRSWCNPSTWLNQDRWLDEPGLLEGGKGVEPTNGRDQEIADELLRRQRERQGKS